ncbi:type II toxin-antitoxin system RelE family toxin [Phocoenobacter skyensis]|uniref:Type II toxin-antitoxin system RelE/ParE family toxin n=1 Tax=Phocoenobacter skyensis TaxID=97481 RepID=A0A1H7Y5J7_9PAST|nr:cytotoxic translational repressor of toxin-antitoxin stability system [Pasteurella skyensis]MDP8079954.1 type II toxin-antitoxin system RelE/ParE family toxin [Pasteurella skyensis]MDP8085850.1 type II toxin-antitoxin system RelE/ParE family toxin [Pasteurella skyensis]MDP8185706.1 type II toxin-antitoxin system RelE/ParE family toxin [Pasteurella skyensis]QLB22329.1 cytotoxic translational repressor of toxin-antitoxin stability system [Pasteurella skyensis]SEM41195.1 mRNA-degrading endonuc
MNKIIYQIKALKQLRKIPEQAIIRQNIDELEKMPFCSNVKKLKNHKYAYRLRVGRFRVFFNFDGVINIVSIEEVKKRDERTY